MGGELLSQEAMPLRQPMLGQDVVTVLEDFCSEYPPCGGIKPEWTVTWESQGNMCRALVAVQLLGVPHKFSGTPCQDEDSARKDTARRTLWYLQCPGFGDEYEPDPDAPAAKEREIPAPLPNWTSSEPVDETSAQLAERKTALIHVQNRLQHIFGRELQPGQSIWEWRYETDHSATTWPARCPIRRVWARLQLSRSLCELRSQAPQIAERRWKWTIQRWKGEMRRNSKVLV